MSILACRPVGRSSDIFGTFFANTSGSTVPAALPGHFRLRGAKNYGQTLRTLQHRIRLQPCSCSGDSNSSGKGQETLPSAATTSKQTASENSIIGESDAAFLIKLLIISFAGSAVVKYGSLLLDTPFQPSLPLALSIICVPCVAYGIFLSVKSRDLL